MLIMFLCELLMGRVKQTFTDKSFLVIYHNVKSV